LPGRKRNKEVASFAVRAGVDKRQEVNIRPRDIPAANAIIMNFFLGLSAANFLLTRHNFVLSPSLGRNFDPCHIFGQYNGASLFSAFGGGNLTTVVTLYKLKAGNCAVIRVGRGYFLSGVDAGGGGGAATGILFH
jgi:hypothetical protein